MRFAAIIASVKAHRVALHRFTATALSMRAAAGIVVDVCIRVLLTAYATNRA